MCVASDKDKDMMVSCWCVQQGRSLIQSHKQLATYTSLFSRDLCILSLFKYEQRHYISVYVKILTKHHYYTWTLVSDVLYYMLILMVTAFSFFFPIRLLEERVDPNHRHRLGWTALMVASMNRQHRFVCVSSN